MTQPGNPLITLLQDLSQQQQAQLNAMESRLKRHVELHLGLAEIQIKSIEGYLERVTPHSAAPDQSENPPGQPPAAPPRGVDFVADLRAGLPDFAPKTIFDVGANIGVAAKSYLQSFPNSAIYCFEPIRTTFEKLEKELSSAKTVQCFNIGFGSVAGVLPMLSDLAHPTRSKIIRERNRTYRDGATLVEVPIDTLDNFCEAHDISNIDILKIDTEGYDLEVLKGGQSILSNGRVRVVLVEAGMNPDNDLHVPFRELYDFLQEVGFYLFALYEQKDAWIDRLPHLRRANLAFIKKPDGRKELPR